MSAGGGNQGRTSVGRDCFKCLPALADSLHMMIGTTSDVLELFFIPVCSRIRSKQSVATPLSMLPFGNIHLVEQYDRQVFFLDVTEVHLI